MYIYGLSLIEGLESEGRTVFTINQAQKKLKLSHKATIEVLSRLKRNGRIVTLTRGLYALLHPSEKKVGIRPLTIIDPLMKYRQCNYYVALLSAADYWGTAHQKPMVLQIMVKNRLSLKRAKHLKIQHHLQKRYPKMGITTGKTTTGYFNISSPELTALDTLSYESACGGFDNISLVIKELITQMKPDDLLFSCKGYGMRTSVQKLEFILEYFGADKKLLAPLKQWVKEQDWPAIETIKMRPEI